LVIGVFKIIFGFYLINLFFNKLKKKKKKKKDKKKKKREKKK
jgi:uncharacterized membrane protein YfcA